MRVENVWERRHEFLALNPAGEVPVLVEPDGTALSGGNVQKALLARELSQDPRVVVYNKPTHGLDLANATALHERIREQAEAGVAAIVISNELDELLGLCGRIGVMYRGRLRGIIVNGAQAEARIGALMIGGAAA